MRHLSSDIDFNSMGKKNILKSSILNGGKNINEDEIGDTGNELNDGEISKKISVFTSAIRNECSSTSELNQSEENKDLEDNHTTKYDENFTQPTGSPKKKCKKKSKKSNDNTSIIQCKLKSSENKLENDIEEDQAESVDSGIVPDVRDSPQLFDSEAHLLSEYTFIKDLIRHAPQYNSFNAIKFEIPPKLAKKKVKIDTGSTTIKESESNGVTRTEGNDTKIVKTECPADDPSIKEMRAKIEAQLKALKAGKLSSVPVHKVRMTIDKLHRKLQILAKRERKEQQKLKSEAKADTATPSVNTGATSSGVNIYNQCGNLVFNKFDFGGGKEIWSDGKPNDIKKIMTKVIREKEMIKHIAANNQTKEATHRLENNLWDNAMKKAGGEKVKDNPLLLAKSLKKKSKAKESSQKKWAQHGKMVDKIRKDKQDKRKANLKKRKDQKIQKKMNRGKKQKGGSSKGGANKANNKKKKTEKSPGF